MISNNSNSTSRKTSDVSSQTDEKSIKKSSKRNVLDRYRSYTYQFTLSCLDRIKVNDPRTYRGKGDLDLIILKSGGKAGKTMGAPSSLSNLQKSTVLDAASKRKDWGAALEEDYYDWEKRVSGTLYSRQLEINQKVVNEFNKNSPGRFDLYIDNVDVSTIMAFTERSNTTLVTALSFEVFEPYSIIGFMDALHAASVAAGFTSYMGTPFLLKIEFLGYPDDQYLPIPEPIDKTARYIPFVFTKIDVDVSEKGTRYKCQGVPVDQLAFGESGVLKTPIQITGKTVGEILKNLMDERTKIQEKSDKDVAETNKATNYDKFEIRFPIIRDGKRIADDGNDISNAELTQLLLESNVYQLIDPGTAPHPDAYDPTDKRPRIKYNPDSPVATFANKVNIYEIISSVIRDSEYLRGRIKKGSNLIKENDHVDFWRIGVKVLYGEYDEKTRKSFRTIIYEVVPYEVHYTQLPGYNGDLADASKVRDLALRSYNYIYSGKNTDVLNFKLNFNSMFYETVPERLGNNEYIFAKDALGKNNSNLFTIRARNRENAVRHALGIPILQSSNETADVHSNGPNSRPNLPDPAYALARESVRSLLNSSKFSMLTGELEILGDPFYLVTGGIGNYYPEVVTPGETTDGEADNNYAQVLVGLNFKNPIDIKPLKDGEGGLVQFDQDLTFSGIYRVNKVKSSFRQGVFRQSLDVMRLIGLTDDLQIVDEPEKALGKKENPSDQRVVDTAQGKLVAPKKTTLYDLVSGVNRFVNDAKSIESRIVNEAQGVISGVTAGIANVVATPVREVAKFTNSITSRIQGASNEINQAASKLGITAQQLRSLSPLDLAAMITISKVIPDNVNISKFEEQGGIVNPDPKKLGNIPPSQDDELPF